MQLRATAVSLFAVFALVGLVGCGDSPDSGQSLPKGNPAPKQTFGLINGTGPSGDVAADDGQQDLGNPQPTGQTNQHNVTKPKLH